MQSITNSNFIHRASLMSHQIVEKIKHNQIIKKFIPKGHSIASEPKLNELKVDLMTIEQQISPTPIEPIVKSEESDSVPIQQSESYNADEFPLHFLAKNLQYAALKNVAFEGLKTLVADGANLYELDKEGNSPISIIIAQGNFKIAKELNEVKLRKDTPLHHAIIEDDEKKVEDLVGKGADVNALSSRGKTPLELAIATDNPKVTQILLEHGANLDKATLENYKFSLNQLTICSNEAAKMIYNQQQEKEKPPTPKNTSLNKTDILKVRTSLKHQKIHKRKTQSEDPQEAIFSREITKRIFSIIGAAENEKNKLEAKQKLVNKESDDDSWDDAEKFFNEQEKIRGLK